MDGHLQIGNVLRGDINSLYERILGREGDAAGIAHYQSVFDAAGNDIAAQNAAYNSIQNALVSSDEYQNRAANDQGLFLLGNPSGDFTEAPSLINNPNSLYTVEHNVGDSTGTSVWSGPGIPDEGLLVGTENQFAEFEPGFGGAPEAPMFESNTTDNDPFGSFNNGFEFGSVEDMYDEIFGDMGSEATSFSSPKSVWDDSGNAWSDDVFGGNDPKVFNNDFSSMSSFKNAMDNIDSLANNSMNDAYKRTSGSVFL